MHPPDADLAAWRGVEAVIENLLPYYERVNLVNTFGRLPFWRKRLARVVRRQDVVLEIGSGPGGFARLVHARKVVCLDPSRTMLAFAAGRLAGNGYRFLSGIAEQMPVRGGTVDKVFCSFSFRDFLDQPASVREIARVLRPGGELHILEAAPPPAGLRHAFMKSWLTFGVPAIVGALVPAKVRRTWGEPPFRAFSRSYEAMEPPEAYAVLLERSGFSDVRLRYLSMRAVFHLQGVRARTT